MVFDKTIFWDWTIHHSRDFSRAKKQSGSNPVWTTTLGVEFNFGKNEFETNSIHLITKEVMLEVEIFLWHSADNNSLSFLFYFSERKIQAGGRDDRNVR